MRLLMCVFLLLLSACATPTSCSLVALAHMPLDDDGDLMSVSAGINGHPLRLLVDTGAERTTLTQAAAGRLGLPHIFQYVTRTVGVAGMSAGWDLAVPGIDLGGRHFPIDRVAVGQFGLGHVAGRSIDGLLGADILLAFDMDIDMPSHQLTLYRVRRCPDARPPWQQPAMEITGIGNRRDLMLVPVELDGQEGTAILDTGAQLNAVSMAFARRTGLLPGELESDPHIGLYGASPGMLHVPLHRFRQLRVGPMVVPTPIFQVVPDDSVVGDTLLGESFLHGRRIWLSFATGHLFVSEPDAPNRLAGSR